MSEVAIIDSGGANIASLVHALRRLGCKARLTRDPAEVQAAARVILPGVGAAADAMARLRRHGLADIVPGLSQPVLGICLGMQLMFEASEEGETGCLGILPGAARRLRPAPDRPVPHMGWNQLDVRIPVPLLHGVKTGDYTYFVHSFALPVGEDSVATCDYGGAFTAVVSRGNFHGTQFHPERSGKVGARILGNFLEVA